jgi:hypothetical protein
MKSPRTRPTGRPLADLCSADLDACPVWQYSLRDSRDPSDPLLVPVNRIPSRNPLGKLFAVELALRGGQRVWGLVGGVNARDARLTQHMATLALHRNSKWFLLARYHDPDYSTRGPAQLADFLGIPVEDVFPIAFDVAHLVEGSPEALRGTVERDPVGRLDEAGLIDLVLRASSSSP